MSSVFLQILIFYESLEDPYYSKIMFLFPQGLQAIRCPAGLYFDIDKQTCDWKDAVKNCKLKNKERKVKPLLFTDEPLCQDGYLACGDSACIERGLFCNGEKDCADGSDENSCGKLTFDSFSFSISCKVLLTTKRWLKLLFVWVEIHWPGLEGWILIVTKRGQRQTISHKPSLYWRAQEQKELWILKREGSWTNLLYTHVKFSWVLMYLSRFFILSSLSVRLSRLNNLYAKDSLKTFSLFQPSEKPLTNWQF